MKKLLSILAAAGLTATTSATVVACGDEKPSKTENNENNEGGNKPKPDKDISNEFEKKPTAENPEKYIYSWNADEIEIDGESPTRLPAAINGYFGDKDKDEMKNQIVYRILLRLSNDEFTTNATLKQAMRKMYDDVFDGKGLKWSDFIPNLDSTLNDLKDATKDETSFSIKLDTQNDKIKEYLKAWTGSVEFFFKFEKKA